MRVASQAEFDRRLEEHINERCSRPTNFPEIIRRAIDEGIHFPVHRAQGAFKWMILADTEVEIRLPATLKGVEGSICIGFEGNQLKHKI